MIQREGDGVGNTVCLCTWIAVGAAITRSFLGCVIVVIFVFCVCSHGECKLIVLRIRYFKCGLCCGCFLCWLRVRTMCSLS